MQGVPEDQSFIDYLGQGTLDAYRGQDKLNENPTSQGDSGLSGGAIAGIVIGCIAGVALIGLGVFVWHKKSGNNFFKYSPDPTEPISI